MEYTVKDLHCKHCGTHLAEIANTSKVRKDLIPLCQNCYEYITAPKSTDMPDFMELLMGGKK
jgi:NAD-dependent SIR2 family protein deacetylase